MKKSSFLAGIAFLLCLSSCGQSGQNVKKQQSFDSTGKVTSTIEYTYKGNDLLTMKEVTESETSLLTNTYNSKGLLDYYTIQVLENGSYVDKYLTSYTYDNHDNLLSVEDFVWKKETGHYQISCLTTYEFDSRGNPTRIRGIDYHDDMTVYIQTEILTQYNSENLVTKEDQYIYDGTLGSMVYFSGEIYEYEADNKTLTKVTTYDENEEVLMTATYTNNEDKTVKEITTTKVRDGVTVPFKVETFEYNAHKDPTMHKSVYSDNGFGDEVIRWEYDGQNRKTKESFFDLEGDNEVLDSYTVFSY